MLVKNFYDYCEKLMEDIKKDESDTMEKAAHMIADAVAEGKNFFIHDRGHLIGGELLARAGGAAFVRRLDIPLPDGLLQAPHTGSRQASREKLSGEKLTKVKQDFEKKFVEYVFDVNGLLQGDVLLLNSNSGYGFSSYAIAKTAHDKGVKLIVMSSSETAGKISPESGERKISEFADLLFDNHAPYGDAVFKLDGLEESIWPASGMGAVFIAWPLVLRTVEILLEKGVSPTVFRSTNIPGGPEQNNAVVKRYEEKGY